MRDYLNDASGSTVIFVANRHSAQKEVVRLMSYRAAALAADAAAIEKDLPGSGLLAATITGKYGDHLPLCVRKRSPARTEQDVEHYQRAASASDCAGARA